MEGTGKEFQSMTAFQRPDDYVDTSARSSLDIPGARAFRINNFFSQEECLHYINEAERLKFASIDWEYTKEYRDCIRVVAKSEEMAMSLWNRILVHLNRDDIADVRPYGFGATHGMWAPIGVNPVIRFSKYSHGGHFNPHRDGGFVINDNLRSIFTVLVFLNEDFSGGETLFFDDIIGATPVLPYQSEEPCLRLQPKTGTAVIFNHDCRHSGNVVTEGSKYIFRTDIMFQRIDLLSSELTPEDAYAECPEYHEAERLYQLSIDLQKKGDPKGSTEAYLRALEMHATLPSIPKKNTKSESSNALTELPKDIWLQIVKYLSTSDIGRLSCISKSGSNLTDSSVWRIMYQKFYPKSIYPSLSMAVQQVASHLNSGKPVLIESDAAMALGLVHQDWRSLFRYRSLAEAHFQVVYIDIGAYNTKLCALGRLPLERGGYYYHSVGKLAENGIGKIRSICHRTVGHYWGAGGGYVEVYVGADTSRSIYSNSTKPFYDPVKEGTVLFTAAVESIVMFAYQRMFEKSLSPRQHPLLLTIPPFVSKQEKELLHATLFTDLRIPFIALMSSSLMTLYSYHKQEETCLVVSVGARYIWAECFIEGQSLHSTPVEYKIISDWENQFLSPADCESVVENVVHLVIDAVQNAPENRRSLLVKNIVLTGGRASILYDDIARALGSACQLGGLSIPTLHTSPDPQFDIIKGCESFLAVPESRSCFACIDALPERLLKLIHRDRDWEEEAGGTTLQEHIMYWGGFAKCWQVTLKKVFGTKKWYDDWNTVPDKPMPKGMERYEDFATRVPNRALWFYNDGLNYACGNSQY